MIKEEILGLLKEVIKENVSVEVFVPDNENFGHYSTNVAFQLSKTLKKSPLETAKEIISLFKTHSSSFIDKVDVAEPGFINFWLKPEIFQEEVKEILKQKENYGADYFKNNNEIKNINIEFISANPTGQLHLGHGRGVFFGDTLANLLKFSGHSVTKEFYINDAKASNQIRDLGGSAIGTGEIYKTADIEKIIKSMKKDFEGKSEGEAGYLLAQVIQKKNKDFIENVLNIKFDNYFSEEELYKKNEIEKLKKELGEKDLVYEKEGALWFKASQFGDSEDRVLIRSTGEPTYFITDLAYQLNKFRERKFDQAIDIWGADHHGYESRLRGGLNSLEALKSNDDFRVIITQMVRLVKDGKEMKMSKRAGDYLTLEELIKDVGLNAARFFFLMYSLDTHMDFDLDLAKEKSAKNPVYYVQYSAVRCQSILVKNKEREMIKDELFELLNTAEDLSLMRMLVRFPEVIEESARNYNPQAVVRYSLELAKEFNNFYEKERVVVEDEKITSARLVLISATLIIFKNIFKIIGISLPEKM